MIGEIRLAEIRIFIGQAMYPLEIQQGQHVSFEYCPLGCNHTPDGMKEQVSDAVIENDNGRTIQVTWKNGEGKTRHTVLLRRSYHPNTYRFDARIGHPKIAGKL